MVIREPILHVTGDEFNNSNYKPYLSSYFDVLYDSFDLSYDASLALQSITEYYNLDTIDKTILIKLREYHDNDSNKLIASRILSPYVDGFNNIFNIKIVNYYPNLTDDSREVTFPIIKLIDCKIISWNIINDLSVSNGIPYDITFKADKLEFLWQE
jgi:hypothetical protein